MSDEWRPDDEKMRQYAERLGAVLAEYIVDVNRIYDEWFHKMSEHCKQLGIEVEPGEPIIVEIRYGEASDEG